MQSQKVPANMHIHEPAKKLDDKSQILKIAAGSGNFGRTGRH
jgi:hypothetical protein